MFFSPLFSDPICVRVNGASGILVLGASQEADPCILGKTRTCLGSTEEEMAGGQG